MSESNADLACGSTMIINDREDDNSQSPREEEGVGRREKGEQVVSERVSGRGAARWDGDARPSTSPANQERSARQLSSRLSVHMLC